MRKNHSYETHLTVRAHTLLPGQEWTPQLPGWTLLWIENGSGYFLREQKSAPLETGMALLLGDGATGNLRASQLGEMTLRFFNVIPARLTGLLTFGDHELMRAAAQKESAVKIFPADSPFTAKLNQLPGLPKPFGFSPGLSLLQFFAEAFSHERQDVKPVADTTDAKERLRLLLAEMSPDELTEMDFGELAARAGCTPRHLSRLFQELVGTSFREKRVEIRLARAQELLAVGKSKVVEVALESGFKSLSLFNLLFTRRFGTSPGRWRRKFSAPVKISGHRLKKSRERLFA